MYRPGNGVPSDAARVPAKRNERLEVTEVEAVREGEDDVRVRRIRLAGPGGKGVEAAVTSRYE